MTFESSSLLRSEFALMHCDTFLQLEKYHKNKSLIKSIKRLTIGFIFSQ